MEENDVLAVTFLQPEELREAEITTATVAIVDVYVSGYVFDRGRSKSSFGAYIAFNSRERDGSIGVFNS